MTSAERPPEDDPDRRRDGPDAGGAGAGEVPPAGTPPPGAGDVPPTGTPPPGPAGSYPAPQSSGPGVPPQASVAPDSRNWALAAHLSAFAMFVGIPWFIGPLIVWLVKREDPFVDAHGKESVNFNLSVLIYGVALAVGGVVVGILTLGLAVPVIVLAAAALGVGWFVLVIIAAVKASAGEVYHYPLTIRLLQ